MDFIPAMVDLVAEAEIQRKVRPQLEVVLNKHLRTLQASAELGRVACAPVLRQAKQEVGVLQAGNGIRRSYPVVGSTVQSSVYWPEYCMVPALVLPQVVESSR